MSLHPTIVYKNTKLMMIRTAENRNDTFDDFMLASVK
jgi:hypothetical protein